MVDVVMDEIGLVGQIERLSGTPTSRNTREFRPELVKAMILDGLHSGFVSAPLYLFREFFEGKATERLIAPGVKPESI